MTISSRTATCLRLFALGIVTAAAIACGGDGDATPPSSPSLPDASQPGSGRVAGEGIPAPDSTLNETSPVTAFIRYGDALLFAADTPGIATLQRNVSGATSELRVRSEVGLPNTDTTAYVRGRIIAKFETVRANSAYGIPVGNAYLWVRDTGGHNYVSTLFWRNYATGDTGRTTVLQQLHSGQRGETGTRAECYVMGELDDAAGVCCLCGDGRYNCPFFASMSVARLDSLLVLKGKPLRSP